jgi:hypothetical protein
MPRYLLFAGPDGCLLADADAPPEAPPGYQAAGEFEAPDQAAAVAEARRRVAELQARMEAK